MINKPTLSEMYSKTLKYLYTLLGMKQVLLNNSNNNEDKQKLEQDIEEIEYHIKLNKECQLLNNNN